MVLQLLALWLVLVLSALQSASAAKRVIVDDPEKLVHLLPKVELHAHLHGSIRSSTLLELTGDESFTVLEKDLTLEACFQRFSAVYKAVANRQVLERVIGEVLVDFMDDNVVYLELRTTPRSLPDGTTEEEYVQLLVDKVKRHNSLYGHLLSVKLILSVNRSKSYDEGLHILELAEKYRYGTEKDATKSEDPLIVGLDFSGNPNGARFEDFQPIFAEARKVGFNITVHCGETAELSNTPGPSGMDETKSIIKFRPDRIGHALFLEKSHMTELVKMSLEGNAPPIEICPTSNFFTLHLKSYADHPHIRRLLAVGYPISINTDDTGVFFTSLTKEYLHIMQALHISTDDMVELAAAVIDQIFASEKEKMAITERFWSKMTRVVQENGFHLDLNEIKDRKNAHNEDVDLNSFFVM